MPHLLLTLFALFAFAGNSVLCRLALADTGIDAATFTTVRLASGALVLWLLAGGLRRRHEGRGRWSSALALFAYAAGFSYAYAHLTVATGALLLFAAVQATMIGHDLRAGARLAGRQLAGLALAMGGLVVLLLPGLTAPPLAGSVLMIASGIAWGIYSLHGLGAGDPTRVSAGNFLRATFCALLLSAVTAGGARLDAAGIGYAVASGTLASALGYIAWYAALPWLRATRAATVQLSVPVIAAFGGALLVDEPLTARILLASAAILGGIALVVARRVPGSVPKT